MIGLANRSARPKTCRSRGNQTAGIGTTGSIAAIIAGILIIGANSDLQSGGKSRKEMSMSSRHSESSTNPSSRKRKSESARTKLAKLGWLCVITLAVLFLVIPVVLRLFLHDPLPAGVRTQFNRLTAARNQITDLVSRAKQFNSDDALADVHANYDRLQHDINQAIQTAEDGIANNSVDAGYLQPGLVVLGSQAIALQDSLIPIAHPVSEAGMGTGILEFLRWVLDNALATWRELFGKKDEMDRAAERQLDQTKWPDWNSIEKHSGI